MSRTIAPSLACVLLLPVLAACRSTPSQPTRLIDTLEKAPFTEHEVRARLNGFVRVFAGVVATTADGIREEAGPDSPVGEHALLWKIHAVPACISAASDPDPLAGFLDVFVLARQMTAYLEEGIGRNRFGPFQDRAIEASQSLVARLEVISEELAGPEQTATTRGNVERFVANHPLRDDHFTRDSSIPLLRQLTSGPETSVWGALSKVEETVQDLTERVSLYVELLPQVARWQVELVLNDALEHSRLRGSLEDVAQLRESVLEALERLDPILTGEKELSIQAGASDRLLTQIDSRVDDAFSDLRVERDALLEAADARIADLKQTLQSERETILASIDTQRVDTLETIRAEREAILTDVERQTKEALARVDELAARRIEDAAARAEALLDGAMGRAFRYALALLGAAFVGAVVLVVLARRRRAD